MLGLGIADIVLYSFAVPFCRMVRLKFFCIVMLLTSSAITVSSGKKSAFLFLVIGISLGEYLRIFYFDNQKKYFLKIQFICISLLLSILWAILIYYKTIHRHDYPLTYLFL
jgi:hypothetical protein